MSERKPGTLREDAVYVADIRDAIIKIERYAAGRTFDEFSRDSLVVDAIVRNLEAIGEAAKKLSPETKQRAEGVDWRKIAGLRDILIHEYFGIDLAIIWDIVKTKVPELKRAIRAL